MFCDIRDSISAFRYLSVWIRKGVQIVDGPGYRIDNPKTCLRCKNYIDNLSGEKKSIAENQRAQDYRKVTPKLQLFQTDDQGTQRIRSELANVLDELPKEKLAEALEAAKSLLKR